MCDDAAMRLCCQEFVLENGVMCDLSEKLVHIERIFSDARDIILVSFCFETVVSILRDNFPVMNSSDDKLSNSSMVIRGIDLIIRFSTTNVCFHLKHRRSIRDCECFVRQLVPVTDTSLSQSCTIRFLCHSLSFVSELLCAFDRSSNTLVLAQACREKHSALCTQ